MDGVMIFTIISSIIAVVLGTIAGLRDDNKTEKSNN